MSRESKKGLRNVLMVLSFLHGFCDVIYDIYAFESKLVQGQLHPASPYHITKFTVAEYKTHYKTTQAGYNISSF